MYNSNLACPLNSTCTTTKSSSSLCNKTLPSKLLHSTFIFYLSISEQHYIARSVLLMILCSLLNIYHII